jgi:hypothetical protein
MAHKRTSGRKQVPQVRQAQVGVLGDQAILSVPSALATSAGEPDGRGRPCALLLLDNVKLAGLQLARLNAERLGDGLLIDLGHRLGV